MRIASTHILVCLVLFLGLGCENGGAPVTGTQARARSPQTPRPPSTQSILVDTREGGAQSIQDSAVSSLAEANAAAGVRTHGAASFRFTSDFDGQGTSAWVARYRGVAGNFGDRRAFLHTDIEPAREVYVQWKQWMGRRDGDGVGWGELGSFDFTNHEDPVGNASRKNLRIVGQGWNGANALWTGSMPGPEPVVLQFFDEQHFNVIRSGGDWATSAEELEGRELEFTYRIRAESSRERADGVLETWLRVGDRLVYHDSIGDIRMGARDVRGINVGLMIRSPIEDMSEYFWDLLIWSGQGAQDG